MSWYLWKRWRFAWAAGSGNALRSEIYDGHGKWLCLFGKVFLLTKRR